MKKIFLPLCLLALVGPGCTPNIQLSPTPAPVVETASTLMPAPFPTASATDAPGLILGGEARPNTLQPAGPDAFAPGVNPLSGLRVMDSTMLDLPAVLVSISNMPPTARPQAGTGFAAWIFELFIGEGTSRFMGVFYGDLPRRIPNLTGPCPVNTSAFKPSNPWLGRRVWLDENQDGVQDPWEAGVGGVCVSLYEAASGKLLQQTSTDSNGYYGFDLSTADIDYTLKFEAQTAYQLTTSGGREADKTSPPAQPGNVWLTAPFKVKASSGATFDIGLALTRPVPATPSPADIAPERTYIGPIRSGRLTYNEFFNMFPGSCLVYASAGDGIRQLLHGCDIVFGEHPDQSPNTALLDVDRMRGLATQSKLPGQTVNYSGNLFDMRAPTGGEPAASLWTYYHAYTQALWQYDPLSGAYLRQTDDADGQGSFHIDTDRLTGRQLAFENVILVLADYQVVRHLQYRVDFGYGLEGWAFLFRDGRVYKMRWSTANRAWEQQTGLLRPIHFIGADKQPFPLKPGRTWISIMTLQSSLQNLGDGAWKAFFVVPDDPPAPK